MADLDLASLRSFLTCARLGSISQAAQVLGRTQPGVSQQVRRLEDQIGESLLQRGSTGVSLTNAGMALLPYAERILALSSEATAGVPRNRLAGRCSVGVLEDLTGTALPAAIADFGRLHPATTLELISLPGLEIAAALKAGRIQLALDDTALFDQPPHWSKSIPLLWAVADGFDTTADPLPLVMFSEPCRWRGLIFAALGAAGRRWRITFESGSLSMVHAAVRAGLGVGTLLPTAMAPGIVPAPVSDRLPALPEIEIGLARRPGSEGDGLVDAIAQLLRHLV